MKKDRKECNYVLLRIKEENLDPTVVEEKKNEDAGRAKNGKEERCRATSANQIEKCFG